MQDKAGGTDLDPTHTMPATTHSRRCCMKKRFLVPVAAVAMFGLMASFASVA